MLSAAEKSLWEEGEICGLGLVFLHQAGEVLVAEPLIICGDD